MKMQLLFLFVLPTILSLHGDNWKDNCSGILIANSLCPVWSFASYSTFNKYMMVETLSEKAILVTSLTDSLGKLVSEHLTMQEVVVLLRGKDKGKCRSFFVRSLKDVIKKYLESYV
jgi:hypothetical protein